MFRVTAIADHDRDVALAFERDAEIAEISMASHATNPALRVAQSGTDTVLFPPISAILDGKIPNVSALRSSRKARELQFVPVSLGANNVTGNISVPFMCTRRPFQQ